MNDNTEKYRLVVFFGTNSKVTGGKLKVWVDKETYINVLLSDELDEEDKRIYLQAMYDAAQEERKHTRRNISLETLKEKGFEPSYTPDFDIDKEQIGKIIIKAFKENLSRNERYIITHRIMRDDRSVTAIADHLHVTERHVRRLQTNALLKLKYYLEKNYPELFID